MCVVIGKFMSIGFYINCFESLEPFTCQFGGYGEPLIMPANGKLDLTGCLKG
jgi:hypothetical protein